ncbi:hypothetical protein M011DRAFT_459150 [Sporormia fimetaria CBS 119925]|uniref:Uncharacterized protein n=1 Tax=Sporormia fimetaria CBS 119925 TaxID=1340428 RepID=A0A6A6VCC2_9PLEO|nr:hypothetical protein M011DRAFT_459150 [Sporormia fimetaria CBS 119925]
MENESTLLEPYLQEAASRLLGRPWDQPIFIPNKYFAPPRIFRNRVNCILLRYGYFDPPHYDDLRDLAHVFFRLPRDPKAFYPKLEEKDKSEEKDTSEEKDCRDYLPVCAIVDVAPDSKVRAYQDSEMRQGIQNVPGAENIVLPQETRVRL